MNIDYFAKADTDGHSQIMFIKFSCPKCRVHIEVDSGQAGRRNQCPKCAAPFLIPQAHLGPGVTVGGFTIIREIGAGGMGYVYLARQISLDREVALKILSPQVADSKEDRARFLDEMRLLARLQHPNIVVAHDAGEDAGVLFLAMDYMAGDSLEKQVKQTGPRPETDALKIALGVSEALAYAWDRHKMLHLDVKPANILTDAHGATKLADFGIARRLTAGQGAVDDGFIRGSPNYMSPEQAQGVEPLDCRSDIYSLGATLYQLVTGRTPFESPTVDETLQKLSRESLPDPRERVPTLSRNLVLLLERMMARDRDRRYKTWDAVIDDIRRVQRKRSLKKSPMGQGESLIKRNDRLPVRGAGDRALATKRHSTSGAGAVRSSETDDSRPALIIGGSVALMLIVALLIYINSVEKKTPQHYRREVVTVPAQPPAQRQPITFQVKPQPAPVAPTPGSTSGLAAKFGEAVRYARENPKDYEGAISRYEAVCDMGPGTEYWRRALAAKRQLEAERWQQVQVVINGLQAKIRPLEAKGRWMDALAIVRDYDGPWKAECAEFRTNVTTYLEKKAREAGVRALRAALDGIAGDVLACNVTSTVQRIVSIDQDPAIQPVTSEWKALRGSIVKAAALQRTLLESFRSSIGKQITVSIKRGRESLQIDGVEGTTIKASRLVETEGGRATVALARNFTLDELTISEKMERVGKEETDDDKMLRGLVCAGERDFAGAKAFFEGCDNEFVQVLLRQTEQLRLRQEAATAAREEAQSEAAAEEAYRRVVASVLPSVGNGLQDAEVIDRLAAEKFTEGQAKMIAGGLDAFYEQHGGADCVVTHADVLAALEDVAATGVSERRRRSHIDFTAAGTSVEGTTCAVKRTASGFFLFPSGREFGAGAAAGRLGFRGNYRIRFRVKMNPAEITTFRVACWPVRRNPNAREFGCYLAYEKGKWRLEGSDPGNADLNIPGYAILLPESEPATKPVVRGKPVEICFERIGNQLRATVDSIRICDIAMDPGRAAAADEAPFRMEIRVEAVSEPKDHIRFRMVEYSVGAAGSNATAKGDKSVPPTNGSR